MGLGVGFWQAASNSMRSGRNLRFMVLLVIHLLYGNLDFPDAAFVHTGYLEAHVFTVKFIAQPREIALELEDESGQRLRLTAHIIKDLVFGFGDLKKVVEERFAVKQVGILIHLPV